MYYDHVAMTPQQKLEYNEYRRNRRSLWQVEVDKLKMETGCEWPDGCSNQITIPAQLEFAHLSQEDKKFAVSKILERSPHKPENRKRLEEEMARCQILCLLHHRVETIAGNHNAYRRGSSV